jgi:hypothetical protein
MIHVISYTFALFLLFINGIFLSCVTLEKKTVQANSAKSVQYWLTTSMYSGRFYDNPELNLIDYRPFDAINEVETVDGYILYPPKPERMIPAGTLVNIVKISYPDKKLKRPIFSPQNNIWVYLQIGRERGEVSIFFDKIHVLVLPENITNDGQVRGYLSRLLSKENPNVWILPLPSHMQDAIFTKRPMIGMNKTQLEATLGPPNKMQWQKKTNFQEEKEMWHYHDYYVTLVNGQINRISPLKKADSHKPGIVIK